MSLPPIPPIQTSALNQPTPPQPNPAPSQAQIEYDRLIAYFDRLLRITGLLLGIVVTAAGILLWRDIRDVRKDAEQAAQTAAAAGIKSQLEEPKLKQQIHDTIEETVSPAVAEAANKKADAVVGPAVEAAVHKDLGPRIEAFRTLIEKDGRVVTHAARLYAEDSSEGVMALAADTEDPTPEVRSYARSLLREAGAHFESTVSPKDLDYWSSQSLSPKDAIGRIAGARGSPRTIAGIFMYMKRRVGWDVPTFDIPAAKKWCAEHKPKCEE